jgi:hypothetical protein
MRARGITLFASLSLMMFYCVGCTMQESGTKPQATSAVKADLPQPHLVKVFGMINDSKGNRRAGVVGVMFAIYEEEKGGAPLWQEVQNIEVDKRGHINGALGSTTREGIPRELFPAGNTRWLGVQVLEPGEVEQPRIPMEDDVTAVTIVIPQPTDSEPTKTEVQEASSEPADYLQAGSQQIQNEPANGQLRARQRYRRSMR